MGVRAKFYVTEVTKTASKGGKVKLSAAARGARNAEWASATPSGSMELQINNPPAFGFFERLLDSAQATGRYPEVFIDITPATDGWPGDGHAFELAEVPDGHYVHGKCAQCGEPEEAHDERSA